MKQWWHTYGGISKGGPWGDNVWCLMTFGESTKQPMEMPPRLEKFPEMVYKWSFDHDPTDAEKLELTPEEYRDND